MSHSKGSTIIRRNFSNFYCVSWKNIYWFSFSFPQSISSCPPQERGTQMHYCTAIPETLQLLVRHEIHRDYLNIPVPCILDQCHLYLPACTTLQLNSPGCAFFFFQRKRDFCFDNLEKETARKVGQQRSSPQTLTKESHRTSIFFSSDIRGEKKTHTRE